MINRLGMIVLCAVLATLALPSPRAQAECFGQLCNKMHSMESDLGCLSGEEVFQCDPPEQSVKNLRSTLAAAHTSMQARVKGDEAKTADVNKFFSDISAGIDTLEKAVKDNNQDQIKSAVDAIHAISAKAHAEFNPHPVGPHGRLPGSTTKKKKAQTTQPST
jgi:hypothetical protein